MRDFFGEQDFAERMREEAEPYLAARRTEQTVAGYDGRPLRVLRFDADAPRGTVFVVHGFTESADKFHELTYYFLREGLSVLICDHRGHGHSYRKADRAVTHIDRFLEYVDDCDCVMREALANCPAPYDLYGHSMGGAISALLLERHPAYFRRAVLTSPMIAPRHDGLPTWISLLVCGFCSLTGRAQKRLFVAGQTPTDPDAAFAQSASRSRARYDYYESLKKADPLLAGGAPSYKWTAEALKVTRKILKKGAPERVRTPVLLFSADADDLVQRAPQEALAARLPQVEFVRVPSKHELYQSEEAVLHPYLTRVLDFFAKEEKNS